MALYYNLTSSGIMIPQALLFCSGFFDIKGLFFFHANFRDDFAISVMNAMGF
jgi:hypothetical protein